MKNPLSQLTLSLSHLADGFARIAQIWQNLREAAIRLNKWAMVLHATGELLVIREKEVHQLDSHGQIRQSRPERSLRSAKRRCMNRKITAK